MRIIVTGGRDFTDAEFVDRHLTKMNPSTIIEGGAQGVDRLARQWAIKHNIPYITVEAEWDKHGKMAGHMRNTKMIVNHPDATILAFPGGKGTRNCMNQAIARKRTVVKAL